MTPSLVTRRAARRLHVWRGWVAREHARAVARARGGIDVVDTHRTVASGVAGGALTGARISVARAAVGALEVARGGAGNAGRAASAGYASIRADARGGGTRVDYHSGPCKSGVV